jgi:Ca2+-binding RTX toxin-like protein
MLGANIEKLTLTGTDAIDGTGNELANTITGNAGANVLDGQGGKDTLVGGAGNDTYVVDMVGETVTESLAGPAGGTDTVRSAVNYTLGLNLENLVLIGAAIAATGNGVANELTGNDLDNTLDGKAGGDNMTGGAGNDLYMVDNAADAVLENLGEGVDEVRSSVALSAAFDDVEHYTFTGATAVNFTGSGADNRIAGTAANDTLAGGAGDDTLIGGGGADSLDGGTGNDTYVIDNAGDKIVDMGGVLDTVQSTIAFVLADGLENLTLAGAGAVGGTGNNAANVITGNSAANRLDGGGGDDTLLGGAGNDTLIGGAGVDDLQGQDGSDTYFVGLGDTVSEINPLTAGGIDLVSSEVDFALGANIEKLTLTGVDAIDGTGNALANTITGNAQDNVLDGQGGKDTLVGGAGNDTYVVDIVGDVVTESLAGAPGGTDTVQSAINYTLGANVENLVLIGAALAATGNTLANELTGNDLNNTLDGKTGADRMTGGEGDDLYVMDVAGDLVIETGASLNDEVRSAVGFSGGIAGVEHYTFTGATAVNFTANDFNNRIAGTAAADTLAGGAGDDTLSGGAGADSLDGGTGNDTYVVDNAGDKITDSGGLLDTVQSSIGFVLADGLENLTLVGAGAVGGTGNNAANNIVGNGAANRLDGGAGDDTLIGGAGNDTLIGGAGTDSLEGGDGSDTYFVGLGDTVVEASALAAGGIDLVSSDVDFTLGANIEKLTLTGTDAIDGTGNALANTITGNAHDNVLDGQGGKDTMAGGAGDDTYVVDMAGEAVTESLAGPAGGTDTVRSAVNYTLGLNLENLVLIGTALTATGNALANELTGNDLANTLNGGLGLDKMAGLLGDDTYVVDNLGDVVEDTGGTDTVQSSIAFDLSDDTGDLLGTVFGQLENLTLTGAAAISGTGNALANAITGNSAANTLTGGAGSDTLNGGGGADSLVGGTENDTYIVDNALDRIDESGGALADVDTVLSFVSFNLGAATVLGAVENLTLTGTGAISGTGNDLHNQIIGNGAANTLSGNAGNDTLSGGGGNDTLAGGAGDDALNGDAGNDLITGGGGDDAIDVSVGNDTVRYTSALDGHDILTGFDGDSLGGGQDVLNLDALFDSLGVTAANRAALVFVDDQGATVDISIDADRDGSNGFELTIATLNTADTIAVGQDIILGT